MKTLTLTATGLSGKEWIKHLENKNYYISRYARNVLESPEYEKHHLKKGQKLKIALITKDDTSFPKTTKELQDYANSLGYIQPPAEIACLLREALSNKEIKDLGVWYVAVLHNPIKDSGGGPGVLRASRSGDGRWLDAFFDHPGNHWVGYGAFAFLVPASTRHSNTQNLPSDTRILELEKRVKALEDRFEKFRTV